MSNDNRVTIRLSKEQYFLYELRAAAKGMRVSTYVKSLLDQSESSSSNQLTELLRLVKNLDEKVAVSQNLMPELFTIGDLQKLYETILGTSLVRTNFQRKILNMNILDRVDKKITGAANKAPYLYKFKK